MKRLMIAFGLPAAGLSAAAAIPAPASGQPVVVPAGETWTVESADDVAALNAAGEAVVSDGATLAFAVCSQDLAAATRLSGPGTVAFDYNGAQENAGAFKAQWDGSGLTGEVVVKTGSALDVRSPLCFGSAKVVAYASGPQYSGAILFSSGTYVLDNAFELYNFNYRPTLTAIASDVTLRGPVTCALGNGAGVVRLNVVMANGSERGKLRLTGGVTSSCTVWNNMDDKRTAATTGPLVVYGAGSTDTALDLGGFNMNTDCAVGTNVIACAVTNGTIYVSHGSRWQLAVDDPFRSVKNVPAGLGWQGAGGWLDLNGHHLLAGQWQYGAKWEGVWNSLSSDETAACPGGFCNNAAKFSTLLFRQMMRCSASRHVRLQMDGNMNVTYDGALAAGSTTVSGTTTTYNDFDVNWPCWLGNFPGASSSMRGSLTAACGALHLASSANYPNVARLVAQDKGAVYVHAGAQLNAAVDLCVEGGGRIYLAQDISVANLYTNGVRVAVEAGAYTTDDFDFLFANDGATQGPTEDLSFTVTVTGGRTPVARVGNVHYDTFADAVADAQGGVVELLADAAFTPAMDFKVKTGGFTLTEDSSAAFAGYRRASGPDADGVTTGVFRASPTFAGGGADVHQLATADDFRELAHWLAQGETFEGHAFALTADVDWDAARDGAFAGIGSATDAAKAFKGVFDGGGRTVRNLVLARTATGLFNRVDGGLVKRLTLDTVTFAAGEGACGGAAFIGTLTDGTAAGLTLAGAFGTADAPLAAAAGIVADATDAAIDACTNLATVAVADGGAAAGLLGRAAGGTVTSKGACRAPASLKSVGVVASGATCGDLALATVDGDWADVLVPAQPLAGVNAYRLMCDLARDIELTGTDSADSSLTLDLTLGTAYSGRVRRDGKKLGRTVLDDPPRLLFDRPFGLAVIIR